MSYSELEKELEWALFHLADKYDWTPTGDRLPDKDGAYIICKDAGRSGWLISLGWLVDGKFDNDYSHWLPLPPPPEGML